MKKININTKLSIDSIKKSFDIIEKQKAYWIKSRDDAKSNELEQQFGQYNELVNISIEIEKKMTDVYSKYNELYELRRNHRTNLPKFNIENASHEDVEYVINHLENRTSSEYKDNPVYIRWKSLSIEQIIEEIEKFQEKFQSEQKETNEKLQKIKEDTVRVYDIFDKADNLTIAVSLHMISSAFKETSKVEWKKVLEENCRFILSFISDNTPICKEISNGVAIFKHFKRQHQLFDKELKRKNLFKELGIFNKKIKLKKIRLLSVNTHLELTGKYFTDQIKKHGF